jgi:hypothetical protein
LFYQSRELVVLELERHEVGQSADACWDEAPELVVVAGELHQVGEGRQVGAQVTVKLVVASVFGVGWCSDKWLVVVVASGEFSVSGAVD